MQTRDIFGLILSVLTVPVLITGLIDPVEGGVALIIAAGLVMATWLLSRVPLPRLEWIGWLMAVVLGVVTIVLAVTVVNPMATPGGPAGGLPWWMWSLIGGYELAVVATIAGGVTYVVRHVKAVRHDRHDGQVLAT